MRFNLDPNDENGRFDFLGFEFYWGRDRKGKNYLKRRTSRKKMSSALKRFTTWCQKKRNLRLKYLMFKLNAELRGDYNYYGVIGVYDSLAEFFYHAKRILFKWLNRRSQKKSYNREAYAQMLKTYKLAKPRIVERRRARKAYARS